MGHMQEGSPRCTWSRKANEAEEEGHRQLRGVSRPPCWSPRQVWWAGKWQVSVLA